MYTVEFSGKFSVTMYVLALLALVIAPSYTYALSCASPAHRIVGYCEKSHCHEGFRVYYLPTAFPCETRAVTEDLTGFHKQLFENFFTLSFTLSGRDLKNGVYEISFISCSKETVESIPWAEFQTKAQQDGKKDWDRYGIDESEWQVRQTSDKTMLLARTTGCTLSLSTTPLADSADALEIIQDDYVGNHFLTLLWYHLRLWVWPLILVPLLATALFILSGWIVSLATNHPKQLLWTLAPILLQALLFLSVIGPATDRWMGPNRLFFYLPCGLLCTFWLIQLLRIWLALVPHLEALSPTPPSTEEETKDED